MLFFCYSPGNITLPPFWIMSSKSCSCTHPLTHTQFCTQLHVWILVGLLSSTLEVDGIWLVYLFIFEVMFFYENYHSNRPKKYDLNVSLNEFFIVLWPNYIGALKKIQFCKLQISTYVVSHVWVKFHPIIRKLKKLWINV